MAGLTVDFTIAPSFIVVGGNPVTLTNITPFSGESVSWTITVPGTSISPALSGSTATYNPLVDGEYTVRMSISAGGLTGTKTKTFIAYEFDSGGGTKCGNFHLSSWESAIRSGAPKFETLADGERSIECASGASGHWNSWWNGVVTPGDVLMLTFDMKVSVRAGENAEGMVLFYKAGGTTPMSTALTTETVVDNGGVYQTYTKAITVPPLAAKIRLDMRLWGAVGKMYFKDACLGDQVAVNDAVADIVVKVGDRVVNQYGEVTVDDLVIFDGTGSSGTGISHRWNIGKEGLLSSRVDTTSPTVTRRFDSEGLYTAHLIVTASNGTLDQEIFTFNVVAHKIDYDVTFEWAPSSGEASFNVGFTPNPVMGEISERIYYTWDVLNPSGSVVYTKFTDSFYNDGVASIVFPVPSSVFDSYGMKLTAQFPDGTKVSYSKANIISVDNGSESVVADIVVKNAGVVISDGDVVDKGDLLEFDASGSVGSGLTYFWVIKDSKGIVYDPDITTQKFSTTFNIVETYTIHLSVSSDSGGSDDAYFSFIVEDTTAPKNSVTFAWAPSEGVADFIAVFVPHPVTIAVDDHIEYRWEVFYGESTVILITDTVGTPSDNGAAVITFPVSGYSSIKSYGMKVTATFSDGTTDIFSLAGIITVLDDLPPGTGETEIIGPPTPGTIDGATENVILSSGVHTHKYDISTYGRAGSAPEVDQFGILYLQQLNIGDHDEDTPHVKMLGVVKLAVDGDILLINGGKISGPEIIVDSQNFVTPNLPTHDPHVKGQWWIDTHGKPAISSG